MGHTIWTELYDMKLHTDIFYSPITAVVLLDLFQLLRWFRAGLGWRSLTTFRQRVVPAEETYAVRTIPTRFPPKIFTLLLKW